MLVSQTYRGWGRSRPARWGGPPPRQTCCVSFSWPQSSSVSCPASRGPPAAHVSLLPQHRLKQWHRAATKLRDCPRKLKTTWDSKQIKYSLYSFFLKSKLCNLRAAHPPGCSLLTNHHHTAGCPQLLTARRRFRREPRERRASRAAFTWRSEKARTLNYHDTSRFTDNPVWEK